MGLEATWGDRADDDLRFDDRLVEAARGDPAAFAAIYDAHRVTVFRYARGMFQTDDDAADVAAITFERALRGLGGYRPSERGLRPWLFRIARNVAYDELRRRRRHASIPDSAAATVAAGSGLPLADLIDLRNEVGLLPALDRDAVLLRYAAGLTTSEIGLVLDRSEAATQKLITRALATLREALR